MSQLQIPGLREPTADECGAGAKIADGEYYELYATWYPQMGGHVGKCVVQVRKDAEIIGNGVEAGTCFECWVWHDGEFPFSDDGKTDQQPAYLHHCDGDQFIEFGEFLKSKLELNLERN